MESQIVFENPVILVEMTGFGLRVKFKTVPNQPFILIQRLSEIKKIRDGLTQAVETYEEYSRA